MKVGIITPNYPPNIHGGGEVSVQLLAEELVNQNHIEDVVVYSIDGNSTDTVNGVKIKRIGKLSHNLMEIINPIFSYQFIHKINDNIDILHGYNMALNPSVGFLSSYLSIPSLATMNSYFTIPTKRYGITPSLKRRIYDCMLKLGTGNIMRIFERRINHFIALSNASIEVLSESYDKKKFSVVPNMIDTEFSEGQCAAKVNNDQIRLLFVGNLINRKGVAYLIKSLKYLPKNFSLSIVGDGANLTSLKNISNEVGESERVTFKGSLSYEQVKQHYNSSDIFVHPGIWPEPFGRTLLEAMQFGLPVVATDIGAPSEIVPQQELLCDPKNPQDLAKSIYHAAERRKEIGEYNLEYVHARYSPSHIIEDVTNIYKTLIESKESDNII